MVEGLDLVGMKRHNAGATLRALHRAREATLGQLTEDTGLSRRTVEKVVLSLVDQQWAVERRPGAPASVGRPPRTYGLVPSALVALSVYFAPDRVEVTVCDLYGTRLGQWTETLPSAPAEERIAAGKALIRRALNEIDLPASRIGAATIAISGIVYDDQSVELWSLQSDPPLQELQRERFNLLEQLEAELPCHIELENDAKLSAIGESWRGAARGCSNFVSFYTYGPWTGIGVVIGGAIHRGLDGQAGEVVWADSLGLESMRSNPVSHLGGPDIIRAVEAASIVRRARAGEVAAIEAIRDLATHIAPSISAMVWILAPEAIVIGGTLAPAGDLLSPMITTSVAQTMSMRTQIVPSTIGTSAVTDGALRVALDRIENSLADFVM